MHVKEACDCSFLYWHRSVILPIYLVNVFENPEEVHLLHVSESALLKFLSSPCQHLAFHFCRACLVPWETRPCCCPVWDINLMHKAYWEPLRSKLWSLSWNMWVSGTDHFSTVSCGVNTHSHVSFQIVNPLCTAIETDLRLETHSHLTIGDRNPFNIGLKDPSSLLAIRPIRFFNHFLSIQGLYQASKSSSIKSVP